MQFRSLPTLYKHMILCIVFLSETWSDMEQMKWIQDRIFFDGCFTVPNKGKGVDWLFFGRQVLMYGWIVFRSTT